jgi:hypothetical protein
METPARFDSPAHSSQLERVAQQAARSGFVLASGDRAGAPGGADLCVALRDLATKQHFDPVRVMHWIAPDGRGKHVEIDRGVSVPHETAFAWGVVRVSDHADASNAFLTFGGRLVAVAPDPAMTIVTLSSAAPILRWSGRDQDLDPFAAEVAAFFARLRVPINYTPGAEATISRMAPVALYASAIGDLRARYGRSIVLREANPAMYGRVQHETRWLETSAPADWAAGQHLLQELGLQAAAA